MVAGRKNPGTQKSDSFMETKAGPILYIVAAIAGLWFLLWFANLR
jgi:hypothetical protein